jgi:hypothetical protein
MLRFCGYFSKSVFSNESALMEMDEVITQIQRWRSTKQASVHNNDAGLNVRSIDDKIGILLHSKSDLFSSGPESDERQEPAVGSGTCTGTGSGRKRECDSPTSGNTASADMYALNEDMVAKVTNQSAACFSRVCAFVVL